MKKSLSRVKKPKVGTREKILETALLLLEKKGAHELSLREIARKAKLSTMAPYKHFKDKNDLIAMLGQQGFKDLSEDFKTVERKYLDPAQRFRMMSGAYADFVFNRPALAKLMFGGFIETKDLGKYPDLKCAGDDCYDHLIQMIEYGQHHGFLKAGPVDAMAAIIWSTIHGFSMLWMEKNFEENPGDQTEELKGQLLDIMSHILVNGLKA
ncbi:MAG: TetR/AcrR family transcriptional regulator [Proteobacteria bacterium]|jgi:AcrR family transcriptional regulator|nr:TetR/AcrR family transcriptional regulator [Pseudomonadota bacterium]